MCVSLQEKLQHLPVCFGGDFEIWCSQGWWLYSRFCAQTYRIRQKLLYQSCYHMTHLILHRVDFVQKCQEDLQIILSLLMRSKAIYFLSAVLAMNNQDYSHFEQVCFVDQSELEPLHYYFHCSFPLLPNICHLVIDYTRNLIQIYSFITCILIVW